MTDFGGRSRLFGKASTALESSASGRNSRSFHRFSGAAASAVCVSDVGESKVAAGAAGTALVLSVLQVDAAAADADRLCAVDTRSPAATGGGRGSGRAAELCDNAPLVTENPSW